MSSIMKKISRSLREREAKKGFTSLYNDFTLNEANQEFVIEHLKKFYNIPLALKSDIVIVGLLPSIDQQLLHLYDEFLTSPYTENKTVNIVYNQNQLTRELKKIIDNDKINSFLHEEEIKTSIRGIRSERLGIFKKEYDYHFVEIKPINGKYELTNVFSTADISQYPYKRKWNEITEFLKQVPTYQM